MCNENSSKYMFYYRGYFLVKRNYYVKNSKNENCESDKYSIVLGCCATGFEAVGVLCLLLSL